MIAILTSIFSGGLTGLFGTALTKVGDYFQQKQNFKHELDIMKEQRELIALQSELKINEADAAAFGESVKADRATYTRGQKLSPWASGLLAVVDFIRGMIRPALTIYLIILTTYIYVDIETVLAAAGVDYMTIATASELIRKIILTILYLTVTCVTWWFGSRMKAKPPFGEK